MCITHQMLACSACMRAYLSKLRLCFAQIQTLCAGSGIWNGQMNVSLLERETKRNHKREWARKGAYVFVHLHRCMQFVHPLRAFVCVWIHVRATLINRSQTDTNIERHRHTGNGCFCMLICMCMLTLQACSLKFEHMELSAKSLDYCLRSTKSKSMNAWVFM
jgi:hypothetical protein